ncbi:MAG: CapA family protein [Deltaproteobacteria bacterium]|nr:CapA family protein [Deltaproteobacteria bacterium]
MIRRAALLAFAIAAPGCSSDGAPTGVDDPVVDEESIAEDDLALTPATGPLRFSRACRSGERVTIAAVGDVMPHEPLQRQAYARGWWTVFGGMTKWLDDAHVTYGNLESPTARGIAYTGALVADPGPVFDDWVYTDTPFNVHRGILGALRSAAFDILGAANNHALDRFSLGVDRTLDAMDAAGIAHVGAVRATRRGSFSTRVVRNGFDLRFVACTFSTNGIFDGADQVTHCYLERSRLLSTVRSLRADPDVDAVIVVPHWGAEYSDTPRLKEIDLAHEILEAGATAIIGSHPHVLQPWEKYVTRDGRETFIAYSLGNFVSRHYYLTLARRTSILLYLGLTRGSDGKTFVNGVRYMPIYTRYSGGNWNVTAIDEMGDEVGGYPDARRLATTMFGEWNVRYPGQPLDTTPECR